MPVATVLSLLETSSDVEMLADISLFAGIHPEPGHKVKVDRVVRFIITGRADPTEGVPKVAAPLSNLTVPLNDLAEVYKANAILFRLATAMGYEAHNGVIIADPEDIVRDAVEALALIAAAGRWTGL